MVRDLRHRLLAGRDFTDRDTVGAPAVGIVNETFARRYVKGNPLGQTIRFERGPQGDALRSRSSASSRTRRIGRCGIPIPPVLFLPLAQAHADESPARLEPQRPRGVRLAGAVDPQRRRRHRRASIAIVSLTFRPLAAFVDGALVRERLLAMLSGFFGGLALLLAGIGLYGMTVLLGQPAAGRDRHPHGARRRLVARRRHGAARRSRSRSGSGWSPAPALSYWAARYVGTLLYGLDARDPLTFVGAALFLCVVSLFAAWLPARRAAGIDPARVLRDA